MSRFENLLSDSYDTTLNEGFLDIITRKPFDERVKDARSDSEFISLHRHLNANKEVYPGLADTLKNKTPVTAFMRMSHSQNINDRMIAAKNAPSPVLAGMVNDPNTEVKIEVAKHAPQFHEYMASDNAPIVRNAVASTATKHNVLHKLAGDVDPRVAYTAIGRAQDVLSGHALADVQHNYNKAHPHGYDGLVSFH